MTGRGTEDRWGKELQALSASCFNLEVFTIKKKNKEEEMGAAVVFIAGHNYLVSTMCSEL